MNLQQLKGLKSSSASRKATAKINNNQQSNQEDAMKNNNQYEELEEPIINEVSDQAIAAEGVYAEGRELTASSSTCARNVVPSNFKKARKYGSYLLASASLLLISHEAMAFNLSGGIKGVLMEFITAVNDNWQAVIMLGVMGGVLFGEGDLRIRAQTVGKGASWAVGVIMIAKAVLLVQQNN